VAAEATRELRGEDVAYTLHGEHLPFTRGMHRSNAPELLHLDFDSDVVVALFVLS